MPIASSSLNSLAEKLLATFGFAPTETRRSPIAGHREVKVPAGTPYEDAVFLGDDNTLALANQGMNSTYYRASNFNDPATIGHERIHQAQFLQPNPLSMEDIRGALAPFMPQDSINNYSQRGSLLVTHDPAEPPAYAFEKLRNPSHLISMPQIDASGTVRGYYPTPVGKRQQTAANAYLDANYLKNPSTAYYLDAAMPEPLLREYIASHPRPKATPVQPEPESILSFVRRMFAGK